MSHPAMRYFRRAAAIARDDRHLDDVPSWLLGLIARLAIAPVFWNAGRAKMDGIQISEGTFELFREEYLVPVLPPDIAAILAVTLEHACPVLLVIGLGTRAAAGLLLAMVGVIQVFVYPEAWSVHLTWASILLYLMARGAGAVSIDAALGTAGKRAGRSGAASTRSFTTRRSSSSADL